MAHPAVPVHREPHGYQREPHLRLLLGCAAGALLPALFALVVNFGLGRHPSSIAQVTGGDSGVSGVVDPWVVPRVSQIPHLQTAAAAAPGRTGGVR